MTAREFAGFEFGENAVIPACTKGAARTRARGASWRVAVLTAAIGCIGLSNAARADDMVFTPTTPPSGDYMDGTQWIDASGVTTAPAGATGFVPGAGDRANIAGGNVANFNTAANPNPTATVNTLYVGGEGDGGNGNDNFPAGYKSNTTGNGTLNMSGGTLTVNTWTDIGYADPAVNATNNGVGTFNLTGGTFHQGGGDNVAVGQGGTGAFNISGGGVAQIDSTLNIGRWSATDNHGQGPGVGTVTVGTAGDTTSSLTTNGDLNVGLEGTGTLTQNGGTVTSGAKGGWLYVANKSGSTGTYNLNGGALNVGQRMLVGGSGTGVFNQVGGTVTMSNSDLAIADNNGTGTYNLSGGTVTAMHGAGVGNWSGSTGTLAVSGTGVFNASDLYIGRSDPNNTTAAVSLGTVNQTGGTVSTTGTLTVGGDTGGDTNGHTTGIYNLSAGQLTLGSGGMVIGSTNAVVNNGVNSPNFGAQGAGVFNLTGGTLDANRSILKFGASGTNAAFTFTGGTLQNAGSILFPLNQQGGTLQAGAPGAPNTTTITGSGTGADAYTLGSTGTLHVDIVGGVADNLLVGSGNVTLAGMLQLHEDTTASTGTQYTIIDNTDPVGTGLVTGQFSNALGNMVMADNGQKFAINYAGGDGNDVVLTAQSVPEPATFGLLAGIAGLGLLRRRRHTM